MELRVECTRDAGGTFDPAVVWFGARRVPVDAVVDRWYGREARWWKVATPDGLYVLRRDEGSGAWDLAAVVRE
jgi:hypothetical protein